MQSKNALSNLKNRYVAVLKKCALINVFGTLAFATMLASPFMANEALAADNPAGATIKSMDATDGTYQVPLGQVPALNSSILNNYGNINGGAIYDFGFIRLSAGMFAYRTRNIDYIFNNSGTININSTLSNIYGMYTFTDSSSHNLTNSGTIDLSGEDHIIGMSAYANSGNHSLTNSGIIKAKATDHSAFGMNANASNGNHTLTNKGYIEVSGPYNILGMLVAGSNIDNGIHFLNNIGIITAKSTVGIASEAYGNSSYSVRTWATILRDWTNTDAVFGGTAGVNLTFQNSTLILRPGTEAQGFVWGQEYNVGKQVDGMAAAILDTVSGTILQATTEVPFLKATLTNGNDPANATVRLDKNINADTTPGTVSAQGNLAVVQGQMSNITRKLLQTKYNEIYADLVSDNGNSGIAAGSDMEQNKWTAFLTPYASLTNNSEYNFDGSQMGVTGGASYHFSEKFSLGGHFDFNYAELDADIMDMENNSTSFAFGMHANYNIIPQWYVSAQATGSISQIENEYSLSTGVADSKADYDSKAFYLALNSGYVFEAAKGHTFAPQVGFSYLNMHADSYDINWASAYSMYNMQYESTSYSAFYADLNLNWRSAWQFENNNALALLASVGVRQNLSGSDIDSDFRVFGTEYSTRSNADDTTFLADVGLEWSKNNFSLSLNYNGEYGSEQQVYGAYTTLKFMF